VSDFGTPDKKLAAVCGLFCPSCTVFIGSMEDRSRLERLAERSKATVEQVECHGCRSEKRSLYCDTRCKMTKCAAQKGIDFCVQCDEYPCAELKAFQSQMPHRIELWQSQERIKAVGYEKWYAEMVRQYSCPECRTINSAYDPECRTCGAAPSSNYVKTHEAELAKFREKMAR